MAHGLTALGLYFVPSMNEYIQRSLAACSSNLVCSGFQFLVLFLDEMRDFEADFLLMR